MYYKSILYTLAITLILLASCTSYAQFITTWKTDNPGTSKKNQITIPGKGNYQITWQEVDNPNNKGNAKGQDATTITFPKTGIYKISIQGGLQRIQFSKQKKGDNLKILTINQWGNIHWTTMEEAFYGCENLHCLATDMPNLSQVTSLAYMFAHCSKFNGKVGHWNTANILT